MAKLLMVSTIASTLKAFLLPHVKMLQSEGWVVDGAANGISDNQECGKTFNSVYEIEWTRSPLDITHVIKAMGRIREIVNSGGYEIVHVHTPVASAVARLALRKTRQEKKIKIIYTAHGFHFYKGAPLRNWLLYYPIEKFLSRCTDALVTINKEDYALAKKKFHAKSTYYIPGIGVDIKRFSECCILKEEKRAELGIPNDAFVMLSVGELADRKNQQVVIEALGEIKNPSIYYIIAGKGPLAERYKTRIKELGLESNVLLLGPRTDIDELCRAADVFVHPSVREGLGIAPLEAMAAGLPLISSYINGIKDYTQEGVTGCCVNNPRSVTAICAAIAKILKEPEFAKECGKKNMQIVQDFSLEKSLSAIAGIYKAVIERGNKEKESC